jgi:hypothetical protein
MSGLAAEDWSPLQFHAECFDIWYIETHLPNKHPA